MKTILITGGLGGIGEGLTEHFLSKGCNVIINYNNKNKAIEAKKIYNETYGEDKILFFKADVSKYDEAAEMFEASIEKFGLVDGLFNCASINKDAFIKDMDYDMWQSVINVNLTGVFNCSKLFARQYNGNNGFIINFSSGTAVQGRAKGANYCSSKAGVINLTKNFAIEYAPDIRINCIGLGMIMTDEIYNRYDLGNEKKLEAMNNSIPLGYIGNVSDVVEMADFLAFKGRYITGQLIYVNGGMYMH
mgnify:CR=1 FL=1|jgi:NAD(P)-dependent dehydrogenase (short-subunit alcohol dehydrogenase family)